MVDHVSDVLDAPANQTPDLDEVVRAVMAWHFSPDTGSPYWLGRKAELGFDPLVDVRTFEDLRLFESIEVDWARIPAHLFLPAGCCTEEQRFGVFESGGTTGSPKRVVDLNSRRRNVAFQSMLLDEVGFPRGDGNWLHVGPTGPHVMARNVSNLAWLRGFMCYYIDLDPRWVRRCVSQGRQDLFKAYLDHIVDQVRDVLSTQDIRAMSCTPPVLERLAGTADVYALMRQKIRGIIWGGTSASPETLRLFKEEVFPEATIMGAYGNTMMGVAPQRPPRPGDPAACVFRPYYPYTVVEVVDPGEPSKRVAEDAPGRVKVTTLTRDLFMPPTLERDMATRRRAVDGYPGIELSDVKPRDAVDNAIIEGVY